MALRVRNLKRGLLVLVAECGVRLRLDQQPRALGVTVGGGLGEPLVLVLLGPTASGKTLLAIEFAEHLNLSIINIDSRQLYIGMDIGIHITINIDRDIDLDKDLDIDIKK